MKTPSIIIICLLFAFTIHAQQHIRQYIVHISPTGESDKPLDELTLQLGKPVVQANAFKVVITTDATTLKSVINFISANRIHHSVPGSEFGSFEVKVFDQTALVSEYYLATHQLSKAYLNRLIALLKARHGDKNVIEELQKIVRRIDY
jgi:hypothetical protein